MQKYDLRLILLAMLIGIVIGAANIINLFLAGKLPGSIFFPILNGGVTLMSGVGAYVVFREKMNLRQIIAVFFGIISIIFIS